ncbi:hydantoinase/oxoprolinase family protein [Archaeoglobales archaeon]|nr:MAG: hydantoinase/oxoprolinase family protein [Archaeoglobales archaeon]
MFVGVDVGGTNTDAAVIGEDGITTIKVPNEEGLAGIFKSIEVEEGRLEDSRVVVSTSLPLNLLLSRASEFPTLTVLVPGPGLNYEKKGKIVKGFVNHRGDVVEEINEEEILEILKRERFQNIAIASKFSIRNAEIEKRILSIISSHFDEHSIALSHYAGGMNYPYRINTTIVNAKIKKTVFDLTNTIRNFVDDFFYYKGDGGIIPYRIALENPSELYNSSPAAVAIGAYFLTREKDALVVDIGGTTTDFVIVEDGLPKIIENVNILGDKTLVRCVDSFSIPFGGDSPVENGKLHPGRKGKAVAFGGNHLTLTDVLNLEGFEIGDYRKSREFAKGMEIDSGKIIEDFITMIAEAIESVNAERVVAAGFLGQHLSDMISKKAKISVIVPEHSEAVNAVGVAVSRVSLTMYARFDTESGKAVLNGIVEESPFGVGSLPSDEEMIEEAKKKVLSFAEGYTEEDVSVIYFNSYTVVRGGIKRGKIADIVVQIKPGISKELL